MENERYAKSQRMTNLKLEFQESNKLATLEQLEQKKLEQFNKLKNQIIERLPYFQEVNEMQDIINSNPEVGDQSTETALDAVASFNQDMKVLALNAYQLQDLLNAAVLENKLMVQWMTKLENQTLKAEERIVGLYNKVEVYAN